MLLAYSSSMLVARPTGMASLRDWYGEWEPYHHKTPYNYRENRDTPRRGHAEDAAAHAAEGEDAINNGGIVGGALGGFGQRREGAGNRFGARRNEDRERGERSEGLRLGEVGGRRAGALSGKNPFGQISASGTFKPAGAPGGGRGLPRDPNAEGGDGRRGMGERSTSFGKDRMREMLPDDRRRDPARGDRRRGERGLDVDESREEGEIESPRMRRAGGADTASDWRRPGDRDRAGPFNNLGSDRLRPGERRGGDQRRAGGAPWSGDADDNPAWLEDDSEPLPVDNRAPFGQFGSRRKDGDGLGDGAGGNDMAGAVDSIQAFKAQMKERERRERLARGEPEPEPVAPQESTHSGSFGADREYAFGSEADSRQAELDAIRQEMMAAANQRSVSGGSLYDSISNSHGGAEGGQGGGPPGLPGRSSRFARFFDGRNGPPRDPQAAALAAQQKMLESMGAAKATAPEAASETNKDAPQSPPPNASSSSINISELFSKTSIKDGAQKDGKNVSDADQQSMQKLMAMLQGGGSGSATPNASKGNEGKSEQQQQQFESADQLKALLRGQQGRNGDGGANERPRSIVSPGVSPAESYNQQHQRESSTSSHQQQFPPQQQPQQQQQEQYSQYQQQRSESPAIGGSFNDPRQQMGGIGSPTSPGGPAGVGSPGSAPGLAGFGGFPGGMPGRPPPPGMDPRLMGRPPMGGPGGFQQMPPHIAASLGLARGPLPPGMMPPSPMGVPPGARGPNGAFGFAPFPGGRPPPPPPGMPPQLYQQLMSMPPHIQQQVLSGQGFPPGGLPMGAPGGPRSPYDMPQGAGDRRSQSPSVGGQQQYPYYAQVPGGGGMQGPSSPQHQQQPAQVSVGSQAMNGANLMALLSSGGRNTPTNN